MAVINDEIKANINSIIYDKISSGSKALSVSKLIKVINNNYGIVIDSNELEDILSTNMSINSIVDDKIILGSKESTEELSVDSEIKDNALDQISDHNKFESVADLISYVKPGMSFDASRVKLNESDDHYHLHYSSVKNKCRYIVSEILPQANLNESFIKCKIDGTSFFVNIPIKYFVK
jgi:hypothetical protein